MYQTTGEADTARFAGAFAQMLRAGDSVLLMGDLGMGKSVLARGMARAKGVTGPMASPSFTIMQPYAAAEKVYHFDLYRIADPDEYYAAGLDEFVGGDGIALIEWPEMADIAPVPRAEIHLERGAGFDDRIISIAYFGMEDRQERFAEAVAPWRTEK